MSFLDNPIVEWTSVLLVTRLCLLKPRDWRLWAVLGWTVAGMWDGLWWPLRGALCPAGMVAFVLLVLEDVRGPHQSRRKADSATPR